MAFGGPMPVAPGVAPPPPPKPDPELLRIASSPTWEDILGILRSDRLRGYRIDIETDSTILQDAQADKQSRIEFMTAAKDFLGQAYQALTVAPQMMPVVKEIMMFGVRSFKPGRALEETFEDAFDELAKNPPKPAQEQATIQQDPNGQVKIMLEAKKVENDAAAKAADNQLQTAKAAADQQDKQTGHEIELKRHNDTVALDAQRHVDEVALRSRELALKERDQSLKEAQHGLAVAQHNHQIVSEAMTAHDAANAAPVDGGPQTADLIAQLAQAIVQGQETQAQAQRQLAEAVLAAQQAHGVQVQALATRLSAPKRLVRGSDGRAVGVETVG